MKHMWGNGCSRMRNSDTELYYGSSISYRKRNYVGLGCFNMYLLWQNMMPVDLLGECLCHVATDETTASQTPLK
jgi:hypothetical protein